MTTELTLVDYFITKPLIHCKQMLTEFIDTYNEGPNTPSSQSGGSTTSGENLNGNNETVIALNMIFQFLFQELKDTKGVRRYIIRKLSFEFNELLTAKAAGKFLQKITVKTVAAVREIMLISIFSYCF